MVWLSTLMVYALYAVEKGRGSLSRFLTEDEGASMVEYAILVGLIAIVAITAIQALGSGIAQVFQNILARIQGLGR